MLWKVSDQDLEPVNGTTFTDLKWKEQHLEDWIERKPEILGEPLLIIGRQVQVSGVDNRLDLLAIDRAGNLVVIEVKRDTADVPADFQALRYAAAVANWSYETIKNQAEGYYRGRQPKIEPRFEELTEQFFEEENVDLNEDQRIVIVGRNVHERLVAVANWLLNHNVSVKIVEVALFVDAKTVFVVPHVILPKESIEAIDVTDSDKPWKSDGKKWHLQERCSPQTAQILQTLVDKIPALVTVDSISWNQQDYVAFRVRGRNWLSVETRPQLLVVSFYVKPDLFKADEITKLLGIVIFNHDKTLAAKLDTPSSVDIEHQENRDLVLLRVKPDLDLDSEDFAEFIRRTHKAYPS
jgi:hypothetical protein